MKKEKVLKTLKWTGIIILFSFLFSWGFLEMGVSMSVNNYQSARKEIVATEKKINNAEALKKLGHKTITEKTKKDSVKVSNFSYFFSASTATVNNDEKTEVKEINVYLSEQKNKLASLKQDMKDSDPETNQQKAYSVLPYAFLGVLTWAGFMISIFKIMMLIDDWRDKRKKDE